MFNSTRIKSFTEAHLVFDKMSRARAFADNAANRAAKLLPGCKTHDVEIARCAKWEGEEMRFSKLLSDWLDEGIALEATQRKLRQPDATP